VLADDPARTFLGTTEAAVGRRLAMAGLCGILTALLYLWDFSR